MIPGYGPARQPGHAAQGLGQPYPPPGAGFPAQWGQQLGALPPWMLAGSLAGAAPEATGCGGLAGMGQGQLDAAAMQMAALQMGMWPGAALGGAALADPWLASMYGLGGGMPNAALAAALGAAVRGPGRSSVPPPRRQPRPGEVRRGMPSGGAGAGASSAPRRLPELSAEDVADKEALIKAANQRDEGRCRALLAHPDFAGVDEKDSDGRTALHVATLRRLPEDLGAEILKHPGFKDVNAVDRWGNTALTLAASNSLGQVCLAILERDDFVAINCKDKWGATALHWAADRDLGPVCTAILANPGFVEANTVAFSFCFENRTALQRAEEKGCATAVEAIKKHFNQGK